MATYSPSPPSGRRDQRKGQGLGEFVQRL